MYAYVYIPQVHNSVWQKKNQPQLLCLSPVRTRYYSFWRLIFWPNMDLNGDLDGNKKTDDLYNKNKN